MNVNRIFRIYTFDGFEAHLCCIIRSCSSYWALVVFFAAWHTRDWTVMACKFSPCITSIYFQSATDLERIHRYFASKLSEVAFSLPSLASNCNIALFSFSHLFFIISFSFLFPRRHVQESRCLIIPDEDLHIGAVTCLKLPPSNIPQSNSSSQGLFSSSFNYQLAALSSLSASKSYWERFIRRLKHFGIPRNDDILHVRPEEADGLPGSVGWLVGLKDTLPFWHRDSGDWAQLAHKIESLATLRTEWHLAVEPQRDYLYPETRHNSISWTCG